MDNHLTHDPRAKQQIKDAIYDYLYKPMLLKFSKRLEVIINQHCVLTGNSTKCFIYKGELYCDPTEVPPRKVARLAVQLHSIMDLYLKDVKTLNQQELPYVLGFIGQVLNASNHLPDYLRVFPSSIHQPIEDLVRTCPCRDIKLSQEGIEALQNKNEAAINLLKQRMVLNLLI